MLFSLVLLLYFVEIVIVDYFIFKAGERRSGKMPTGLPEWRIGHPGMWGSLPMANEGPRQDIPPEPANCLFR